MIPKIINKNLNDMKFYIFEQAIYSKIEKNIEQCIKKLNIIQNEDVQILKYRYGKDGTKDFFIEFYYNKWTYKDTPWGGSTYNPQIRIDTRSLNGLSFHTKIEDLQKNIIIKYFRNDELILYNKMLTCIFNIRDSCGKDYKWTKNRYYCKNKWLSGKI